MNVNLGEINQDVVLAIQLGGVLVPLVKGMIANIERIGEKTTTITFTDLVAADTAELTAIKQLSADDLLAINAELQRQGLPPMPSVDTVPPTAVGPEPGKE